MLLQDVYGDDTRLKARPFEWHRRFKEVMEDVKDDHRSGRPSTSRTEKNIELVRKKVNGDRRLTSRMMANDLATNCEEVWKIINKTCGDEEDLCKNDFEVGKCRAEKLACALGWFKILKKKFFL